VQANLVPLVASNRTGTETAKSVPGSSITFYGSSFIAGVHGEIVAVAPESEDGVVLTAAFDLDAARATRTGWGVFRDRRPDLYGALLTLDGIHPVKPTI
jgi:N-carbamoylputrescine amidase